MISVAYKNEIKRKYPEGYFEHWIVMLSSMNTNLNSEGIKSQIKLYIEFEGIKEFKNLKSEVEKIKKNNDFNKFLEVVRTFEIDTINEDHLIMMADIILNE